MRATLRNRVEFSTPTANSVSFAVYVLNHVAANRAFNFNDSTVSGADIETGPTLPRDYIGPSECAQDTDWRKAYQQVSPAEMVRAAPHNSAEVRATGGRGCAHSGYQIILLGRSRSTTAVVKVCRIPALSLRPIGARKYSTGRYPTTLNMNRLLFNNPIVTL